MILFLSGSSFTNDEPDKSIIGSWDFCSITFESNSALIDSILCKNMFEHSSDFKNTRIAFQEDGTYHFIFRTTNKIDESGKYEIKGDSLFFRKSNDTLHFTFINDSTFTFEIIAPAQISDTRIREILKFKYTDEEIDTIDVESIKIQKAIFKLRRAKSSKNE